VKSPCAYAIEALSTRLFVKLEAETAYFIERGVRNGFAEERATGRQAKNENAQFSWAKIGNPSVTEAESMISI